MIKEFVPWDVQLICDSINPVGDRLRTYRVVWPRTLLPEGNTHKRLSRNAASSRAVPTKILLERVMKQPYIPDWTARAKGMSGKPMSEKEKTMKTIWHLQARDQAVCSTLSVFADEPITLEDLQLMTWEEMAAIIDNAPAAPHKQDINRYIEPWLFMDWIVSGTEWDNVFFQRVHRGAHPGFQKVAYKMAKLGFTEVPDPLEWGEWHLPYITESDWKYAESLSYPSNDADGFGWVCQSPGEVLARISAARCGRISYLKVGDDPVADLKWFYDHIYKNTEIGEPPHVSPAEHPAFAKPGNFANYIGFCQLRQTIPNENFTGYTLERLNAYEAEMGYELTTL